MRSGQEYNESIRITHYLEILMMEMSKHRTLLPGIRPCLNFPYPAFGGIISLLLLPKRMPSTPISKPFITSPLPTRKLIVPWSNILPCGLLNRPTYLAVVVFPLQTVCPSPANKSTACIPIFNTLTGLPSFCLFFFYFRF